MMHTAVCCQFQGLCPIFRSLHICTFSLLNRACLKTLCIIAIHTQCCRDVFLVEVAKIRFSTGEMFSSISTSWYYIFSPTIVPISRLLFIHPLECSDLCSTLSHRISNSIWGAKIQCLYWALQTQIGLTVSTWGKPLEVMCTPWVQVLYHGKLENKKLSSLHHVKQNTLPLSKHQKNAFGYEHF